MKLHSDNRTVIEAFSKIKYITIGILLLMVGMMIYGLYLAGKYELNWLYPTSIFGSAILGFIIAILINNYWFKYWIVRVDNPNELFRRSVRFNMVFKSTAIRIAKKFNVDVSKSNYKSTSFVNLPDIIINKRVTLNKNSIIIDQKVYYWRDIDNFELTVNVRRRSFFEATPTLRLILQFNNNSSEDFSLRVIKPNPFEFEYQIDKYLENGKNFQH